MLPYSHTLEELVGAMTRWGMQHRQKIKSEMASGGKSSGKNKSVVIIDRMVKNHILF
ncbi:hypothetical protein [Chryseobacterium carnipullorum]|uniref:hypothetical protein n=1 Tax=Chryseobacterium carnipullorum TaxID=1124835 RepID=UPI001E458B72|nr:hypothetical protein [Chryseobacterium carnipullorum]